MPRYHCDCRRAWFCTWFIGVRLRRVSCSPKPGGLGSSLDAASAGTMLFIDEGGDADASAVRLSSGVCEERLLVLGVSKRRTICWVGLTRGDWRTLRSPRRAIAGSHTTYWTVCAARKSLSSRHLMPVSSLLGATTSVRPPVRRLLLDSGSFCSRCHRHARDVRM